MVTRINLGGEGEVPGVLNQQPPFALGPTWFSCQNGGKTLRELSAAGIPFIIADNDNLPFADNSMDEVITNSVPLDRQTKDGPGVQSSEIMRILKSGGVWFKNANVEFIKP